MNAKVLKLGIQCRDKATQLQGTLTHWIINMGQRVDYLFQPRGLNEEKQPLPCIILEAERLEVKGRDWEEVEVPFEILGTQVTDKPSGFSGMAVEFVRHVNGCFHVVIQPAGKLGKSGKPIKKSEFDLRQCRGPMITELSEKNLKESKARRPSPMSIEREGNIGGKEVM